MIQFFLILCGYLLGSIPFGLWIGLIFFKKDVRQYGSGNTGGTNTARVLGKPIGVLTILLDALKGFLAMLIASFFTQDAMTICFAGLAAVLGHSASIFMKLKGGKSVATFYGYVLGITVFITHNPLVLIAGLACFFLVLYLSKMVSLSSIVSTLFTGVVSFFLFKEMLFIPVSLLVLGLYITYRHKSNIVRIKNKTEPKITWL